MEKRHRKIREKTKASNEREDTPKKVTTETNANIGNGDVLHDSHDMRISGHSTPISAKHRKNDTEESPELMYHCSPIFMPCTQDSEVAWDWQSSVVRAPSEKKNFKNNIETPKRTKQLQKKRNSNSPLLHKPHKRKLVKMENIENIGKFAAELKALTEKMKSMKRNDEEHMANDEKNDLSSILVAEFDDKDEQIMLQVPDDKNSSKSVNEIKKSSASYEDLFDDSINDSMVRCSQEIEAKFNLDIKKESLLPLINSKIQTPYVSERSSQFRAATVVSSESSKTSSVSETSVARANISESHSKNSLNSDSSYFRVKEVSKESDNAVIRRAESSREKEALFKDLEFPDDSFDDIFLATCFENEQSNISSDKTESKRYGKTYKPAANSNMSNEKKTTTFIPKTSASSYQSKLGNKPQFSVKSESIYSYSERSNVNQVSIKKEIKQESDVIPNRKFFKTKSLSDQCFGQTNSSKTSSSVSTNNSITNDKSKYDGNNLAAFGDQKYACTLNRSAGRSAGGSSIIRHSSVNSINTRESAKSLQTQCTPEEIERKRLEAMMRLQAKRKLQTDMKVTNASVQALVQRPVKR